MCEKRAVVQASPSAPAALLVGMLSYLMFAMSEDGRHALWWDVECKNDWETARLDHGITAGATGMVRRQGSRWMSAG
jgi:hypothetical protein